MDIHTARFIISNTDVNRCPKPTLPEYAFIGRSNVGKSSLINMLCGRNKLAKTSGKPGKTQLINHFLINELWYIVDLPGYGYAKVSKSRRGEWEGFIKKYLTTRENLMCLFVLIDSRIPPQQNDLTFMRFLGEKGIPFAMVFTKIDGVTKNKVASVIAAYKREMLKDWEFLPEIFTTSSTAGTGKQELLDYIEKLNGMFEAGKASGAR